MPHTSYRESLMLIAVDIGNTNIVLGLLDGSTISGSYRISTACSHTSDEYGLMITEFLALSHYTPDDVDDVIIASVVPNIMHSFRAAVIKFLHVRPMIVGPGVRTGVDIRIDNPRSLGADCLADCVGAYYVYGGPVLVLDFGTATTANLVDGHGTIRSGLITVGIGVGASALSHSTAQLPQVEITKPHSILATDTRAAMQAGLYYSFLGGVERIIEQSRAEFAHSTGRSTGQDSDRDSEGGDVKVVATGGLGRVFEGDTDLIDVYDPDLIFKGMAVIYARTTAAAKRNE